MAQTALVVCDVQYGIISRVADEASTKPFLDQLATTIKAAREASVKIIYVTIAFQPGHPEIGNNAPKMFAQVKSTQAFVQGDEATQIHESVAPQSGDISVIKHRISAFAGTDLDMILRASEIKHLVFAGISTGGVVLSSFRYALDLDYDPTVLQDLCLENEPEVHKVLCEKVFPAHGTVMSSQAWIEGLKK